MAMPNERQGMAAQKKGVKELSLIRPKAVEVATLNKYLQSVGHDLPVEVTTQFLELCVVFNLNPFLREIYLVGYNQKSQNGPPTKKYNIIVGFEVYLKRAERSGQLNGWKSGTKLVDGELVGYVEICRKDWANPFYSQVRYTEYVQNNRMWKTKPHTMLEKVAISQGFRRCFPNELGGIPYTQEEMSHTIQEAPTPESKGEPQTPPPKKKAAEKIIDVIPEPITEKENTDGAPPDRGDIIQVINKAKMLETLRGVWREYQPIWTSLFKEGSEDRTIIETVFDKKKDALIRKEEKMGTK